MCASTRDHHALELYGLRGWCHGAAFLITVMSPSGTEKVVETLQYDPDDLRIEWYAGGLPRYLEKRRGGISRLVEKYGICVLGYREWTSVKAKLGSTIY